MNRSLGLVYLTSFGANISFYLMLGVTPIFTLAAGHGTFAAAATTSIFMFATVAAELLTTRVMRRIGSQRTLALGIVLLCLPAAALLVDDSLGVILAVCIVRGVGFAFVIIAAAAMVAALAPAGKRGQSLGIYGVALGIPSTFALPAGVGLVDQVGFANLLTVSALLALFGVLMWVVPLPASTVDDVHGMVQALRSPNVLRLAIVFSTTTLASGLLLTYLPIAAGAGFSHAVAALALFAVQLSSTVSRLLAGRFADRRDGRVLLLPGIVLIIVGVLVVLLAPPLVILATTIFGFGFGILQNTTLHLMMESTGPAGYDASSAVWNIAYDVGLGIGALVFGLLGAGYALGASAALVAIAAIAVVTRSGSSASSQHTPG